MGEMHCDETALDDRRRPPVPIAVPQPAGEHRTTEVEVLAVVEQLDCIDIEPRPAVDAERRRQPVRHIHQALVHQGRAGMLLTQTVVDARHVGARIVAGPGHGFGCTAAGGEESVTHRANRLPKFLGCGGVAVEEENPSPRPGCGSGVAVEHVRQPLEQFPNLCRGVHRELRRGSPIFGLAAADHNAHPLGRHRVERVLVRQVVADVHRKGWPGIDDVLEYPLQCPALVPLDVGAQFDHLPTTGDPERLFPASDVVHHRRDLVDVLGRHIPVVDRDGEPLAFDEYTRNVLQTLHQDRGHPVEDGNGGECAGILVFLACGPGEFETVASRVPDPQYADPLPDIGEVTSADHGDGAFGGQSGQCGGHSLDEDRGGRIGHDLGQCAVEVEKDRWSAYAQECGELVTGRHRVGDFGEPAIAGAELDLGRVLDHHVGAPAPQHGRTF
ncbi:hypothetical protein MLGJGCBP_08152 [Rhodococcus sp. T7]|nr:hypothetical protein MLGJGCBP_08152 [Rhodococcus sp. T7]